MTDFLEDLDLKRMAADMGLSLTSTVPDYEWEQMLKRNEISKEMDKESTEQSNKPKRTKEE